MEKITCKQCGTNYAAEVGSCPVCGAGNEQLDELSFLSGGFETKAAEAPEAKASVSEDTGAYRWEDILAEINGAVDSYGAEVEEPKEEQPEQPAKQEPKQPIVLTPSWKNNVPDDDDDDEDDEDEKPAAAPVRHVRERKKKKKGSPIVGAIGVVLVLALLLAAFFAANHFGLFEKPAEPEEEVPELPVTPEEVLCTGISLDLTEITLTEEGASQVLTVTVTPADCTEKVNWISTEPSIAAVDYNGRVTALAEGEANILVSCGSYAVTCDVLVDYTPEEESEESEDATTETESETEGDGEMELSATDITMTYPGELARLYVNNSGEKEITWSTDNETILSIDETGLITAKATGTTNVYAEVDGQSFQCIVRCRLGGEEGQPITVSLNATDISMFYVDETFKFEVTYANGAPEGVTHEWTSSDEAVCTVDQDGIVTAVGSGTCYISTVADGINLKCIVRVNIDTAE